MGTIEFEIINDYGTLSANGNIYFRYIDWNGHKKYDLRRWGEGGEEPFKGITFTEEEMEKLYDVLKYSIETSKSFNSLYTIKIGKATAEIIDCLGEFGNSGNMTKQVCYIDWGHGPKYDIRTWTEDYSVCGKGVTLTENECIKLKEIIEAEFGYAEQYGISFEDFVVKSNVFKCNKKHELEMIQAMISILNYEGEIVNKITSAGYCKHCNCYFILERDYEKLKKSGTPICHVITEKYYLEKGIPFDGSGLNEQSMLNAIGYNVNSSEDLSNLQRQNLLSYAVESGLYTVSGICSFLDWLIDKNTKVTNRDMSDAISKWMADRNYISQYKIGSRPLKGIKSLKVRRIR